MTLTKNSTPDEVRAEWVGALRSGIYEQGQGVLRDARESYCCLGVLCDLAARAGVGKWNPPDHGAGYQFDATPTSSDADSESWFDISRTDLPRQVAKWAGITDEGTLVDPEYWSSVNEPADSLIGLNDSAGYDFDQIADVIEQGRVELT